MRSADNRDVTMETEKEKEKENMELTLKRFTPKTFKGITILEETEIELIEKMEVRHDDIFVVSFPKSGTTLTQEMTYLIATNLDFKTAAERQLDDRFPLLDILEPMLPYYRGVRYLEGLSSPRLIKSHLPLSLLPSQTKTVKPKIIYVARNPKDAFVSFYHFLEYLCELEPGTTLEGFLKIALEDQVYGSPWWKHVLEFWNIRNDENILFLKYEDILKDLPRTVRQISEFLGKTLTQDQVEKISDHCSFTNMKNNDSVNLTYMAKYRKVNPLAGHIIRKGKPGGWRDEVSEDIWTSLEDTVKDKLAGTGLTFDNM